MINRAFPKLLVALHFQAEKIHQKYDQTYVDKLALLRECFKVQKLETEMAKLAAEKDSKTLQPYTKIWKELHSRLRASIKSVSCFKCVPIY